MRAKPAILASWLLMAVWAVTACAAETSADTSAATPASGQDLAKAKHNPFAEQITVPFEFSSSLDVGPGNGTTGGMNVQPAVPLSLSSNWNLILRPSLSLLLTEQPEREFGLSDFELQTFLTPTTYEHWVWGAGPDVLAPTATRHDLGTGKWSAGPVVGVIYMNGPWVNGVLANQLWSFAGDSTRPAVSTASFETLVSYNFDNGWYVDFDPTITADWNANPDKRWTVPVGADVGKVFQLGKKSLSVQVGTYYNVKQAEGVGLWLLRVQISLMYPKHSS